ncbi:MAG: phosphate ABC transporter permease PstA [Lachnospiraceae bacterium]|jgi:phosphate ABC transporter permease subunit PstA|nr:phosphate ABC transporter permease PstA [Lachnospiraceae bacterium]
MQKKQTFEVLGEAAVCFAGLLTLFFGCYLFGCMLAGSLAGELIEVIAGLFPNAIRGVKGIQGQKWIVGQEVWIPFCNTLIMVLVCLAFVLPFGIGTAVFLVEYERRGSRIAELLDFGMELLAGIPSVLYGLFGMVFFVTTLRMGYSILAGSLTMTIVVLPLIVQTTEKALKEVPKELREGGRGVGAGKLSVLFRLVLPEASTGILSGVLLAVGKIVGETAALLYTSGTAEKMPESLLDSGRTLAVQLYLYSSERGGAGKEEFYTDTWRLAFFLVLFVFVLQLAARWLLRRK